MSIWKRILNITPIILLVCMALFAGAVMADGLKKTSGGGGGGTGDADAVAQRLNNFSSNHAPVVLNGKYNYYTIKNPYETVYALNMKTQLHSHTTNSDGFKNITATAQDYRNAGFDAWVNTDHNKIVNGDPNISGLTYLGPGEESNIYGSLSYMSNRRHFVIIGAVSNVNLTDTQSVLDHHHADGAFIIWAHPEWPAQYTGSFPENEYLGWSGLNAVEIYNAILDVDSTTEVDKLLGAGKRIWITADDDCHDTTGSTFNKAWVIVNCAAATKADIMDALRNGRFYATQGPSIETTVSGKAVTFASVSTANIKVYGDHGRILKNISGVTFATYTTIGSEGYIRGQVIHQTSGLKAWSNPLFIESSCSSESMADRLYRTGGVISGTLFPAVPSTNNPFFYNTDTTIIYEWSGSAWMPLHSYGSLAYYVDALGTDDVAKGTSAGTGAFNTWTYMLSRIPPVIGGNVSAYIKKGTYRETAKIQGKQFSGPYSISVFCEMSTMITGQSVTSAGQQSSATAPAWIRKAGAGWTVDAFKKKVFQLYSCTGVPTAATETLGDGTVMPYVTRPVLSNTTSTIYIRALPALPDTTGKFRILDNSVTRLTGADAGAETTIVRASGLDIADGQTAINVYGAHIDYCTNGVMVGMGANGLKLINCEIHNNTFAVNNTGSRVLYLANNIHDNTSRGISGVSPVNWIYYNMFTGPTTHTVYQIWAGDSGANQILGNSFDGTSYTSAGARAIFATRGANLNFGATITIFNTIMNYSVAGEYGVYAERGSTSTADQSQYYSNNANNCYLWEQRALKSLTTPADPTTVNRRYKIIFEDGTTCWVDTHK